MEIIFTDDFRKALKRVPKDATELYEKQSKLFRQNWRDPRLHVKLVRDLKGVFSFRVTRRYRVLFYFHKPDTAVFFEIDHRKDVYR